MAGAGQRLRTGQLSVSTRAESERASKVVEQRGAEGEVSRTNFGALEYPLPRIEE